MGYGLTDARGYVNARDAASARRILAEIREAARQRRRPVASREAYERAVAEAWDRVLQHEGSSEYVRRRYGVGR